MSRAKKSPWRCKRIDDATGKRCTRKAKPTGYCPTCQAIVTPLNLPSEDGRRRIGEAAAQKNVKHGIYSKHWTAEEQEQSLALQQQRGTLNDELDDQRIVLARINRYINQRMTLSEITDAQERTERLQALQMQFEDVEVRAETEGTIVTDEKGNQRVQYSGTPKRTQVRRQMSLEDLLNMRNRYVREIERLELSAKELGAGRGGDPRAIARQIQEAFKEMQEANDVPSPYV